MKLSIFTTIMKPEERMDPYLEALENYSRFADEIIVVAGHKDDLKQIPDKVTRVLIREWPEEFSWDFISQQFNAGLVRCTGDWVLRADIDYFFDEQCISEIRKAIDFYPDAPALALNKIQFLLVDRCSIKSKSPILLNRGKHNVYFSQDGAAKLMLGFKDLDTSSLPYVHTGFYNYDWCFKTKEVVAHDMHRFAKARRRFYGDKDTQPDWGTASEEAALEYFCDMTLKRMNKQAVQIPLKDHPSEIQELIASMKPEQHGYDFWGRYTKASYFI